MWNCRCKVPWLCSDDFLEGLRLWRAACGLCERARDTAAREIDLEGVVCVSFGVAQQHVRRASEGRGIGRLPAQSSFGLWIAPRPVRDAPERETSLLDDIAIELEPNRDRNEGECIREPVANFQVRVVRGEALRGKCHRNNDLAALRLVSRCGVSPGSRWKSANAITRSPDAPLTWTFASNIASATHMSDGCVAMQASLPPRIACMRLWPSMAEQPLAGSRLLQAVAVS